MKATVLGSFPKIPAGPGPSVRAALNRFERREIGPRDLEETYRAVTRRALETFGAAGLTTVTDGQIRWNDLTDPVVRDVDNLVSGGLERFFDNNFYYRRPTVVGRLQWQGGVLAEWTRLARADTDRPLKVALPGPVTVLALADDRSYGDPGTLLADLVEVLALEAASVARAGAVEIQWDEPAAVTDSPVPPADVVAAWRALVAANPDVPQSLAFYFGAQTPWLDRLPEVGVGRVYFDVVTDPALLGPLAAERWPFEVGLGLLDARDVRLEPPETVLRHVAAVAAVQGAARVWLHPNTGLEFLPPDRAADKVRHLGVVARQADAHLAQEGTRDA
ncbi:MAG: synthase [Actinomycetia bacterium]|nr:synthase [Actinomycetes bacterium]